MSIATEQYLADGYLLIRELFSEDEIQKYIDAHTNQINLSKSVAASYLESRESFNSDQSILDLLCNPKIDKIFTELGLNLMLVVAESRLGSSNIGWHRDVTWPTNGIPNYLVVSIALGDAEQGSGLLEYVPKSHLWEVDYEIVGREKITYNSHIGYRYYEKLIDDHGAKPFEFNARKGDVLMWNGATVHRGQEATNDFATRHALTGHFSTQDEKCYPIGTSIGYMKVGS